MGDGGNTRHHRHGPTAKLTGYITQPILPARRAGSFAVASRGCGGVAQLSAERCEATVPLVVGGDEVPVPAGGSPLSVGDGDHERGDGRVVSALVSTM
jgi:hypothetical protein